MALPGFRISILSLQTVQVLIKGRIMRRFIGLFTVCQSTHLGVSSLQSVNYYPASQEWQLRRVLFTKLLGT